MVDGTERDDEKTGSAIALTGHGSLEGVPAVRARSLNDGGVDPAGDYVLYWMTSFRRTRSNFALQRATGRARELGIGVIVLEALRSDYRWASDRFHRFIIDGMADNASSLESRSGVSYYPYVEPSIGEGRGLLGALADRAAVVVTDDYPNFFIPRMLDVAAQRISVLLEAVDGNGLAPVHATDKAYPSAYTFRRYLQKTLPAFLETIPAEDPVSGLEGLPVPEVPAEVLKRWPAADLTGKGAGFDLSALPIDHSIGSTGRSGGQSAAEAQLETFLRRRLSRYADERNQPEEEVASGLSPWLHFGHISTHTVLERLADHEGWTPDFEGKPTDGKRRGRLTRQPT